MDTGPYRSPTWRRRRTRRNDREGLGLVAFVAAVFAIPIASDLAHGVPLGAASGIGVLAWCAAIAATLGDARQRRARAQTHDRGGAA